MRILVSAQLCLLLLIGLLVIPAWTCTSFCMDTPDDHDINWETFLTFCRRFGHEISEEEIAGVVKHIESFGCTD